MIRNKNETEIYLTLILITLYIINLFGMITQSNKLIFRAYYELYFNIADIPIHAIILTTTFTIWI